ncbi:MAG: preprotein translocase subunit YajC [Deltaproteobacteria bacterium]|nr:MAG: preprotein translocase subunit YajC [Deltaproteobacteria bacterium]
MMLQPANAPGRAAQGTAPAAPAAPGDPAAGAEVPEGGPPPQGGFGGMGMMLLLPLLLFGVIFLMNRGDKKKRAALESKLKKGDKVVTRAGFIGKLVEVGEREARIELAPGVNVSMIKTSIEGLYEPPPVGATKDDKSAKSTGGKADKDKADDEKPSKGDAVGKKKK